MNIFIFFIIFTYFLHNLTYYTSTSKSSKKLQNYCVNQIHNKFEKSNELSTIVCGINNLDPESTRKIKNVGLIHVFIMSASQISFWLTLLQKMKLTFMKKFLIINFVNLFSGFQAPVIRYILHFFLKESRNEYKIQTSHFQILICLLVGFFIVRAEDIFSLQLSCLFSLLLCLFEKFDLKKMIFIQFIFLFYSSYIFQQSLSLLSLPLNILFVPLLSFILYPICILIFILSYTMLHSLGNKTFNIMWTQVEAIINWTSAHESLKFNPYLVNSITSNENICSKIGSQTFFLNITEINPNNLFFKYLINLISEIKCSTIFQNVFINLKKIDSVNDPSSRCIVLFILTFLLIHTLNVLRVRSEIKKL